MPNKGVESGEMPECRRSHGEPKLGSVVGCVINSYGSVSTMEMTMGHELDGRGLLQLGFIGYLLSVMFPISRCRLYEQGTP